MHKYIRNTLGILAIAGLVYSSTGCGVVKYARKGAGNSMRASGWLVEKTGYGLEKTGYGIKKGGEMILPPEDKANIKLKRQSKKLDEIAKEAKDKKKGDETQTIDNKVAVTGIYSPTAQEGLKNKEELLKGYKISGETINNYVSMVTSEIQKTYDLLAIKSTLTGDGYNEAAKDLIDYNLGVAVQNLHKYRKDIRKTEGIPKTVKDDLIEQIDDHINKIGFYNLAK